MYLHYYIKVVYKRSTGTSLRAASSAPSASITEMKERQKEKKVEQTTQISLFRSNGSLKGGRKTNKEKCKGISVMPAHVYGFGFERN